MSNINPIKFSIAGQYYKQEAKDDTSKKPETQAKNDEKPEKQLSSGEVLGFMAAQFADVIPSKTTKTVNVSKYVNPQQEAGIAESMKLFEEKFGALSSTAMDEFGIDEDLAGKIAIETINATL